jgi:signal transduction histidine kinase
MERKRISKDLHDGLGYRLLLIKNKISTQKDNTIKTLINNAIEEMRRISKSLHPFKIEGVGISYAIKDLIYLLNQDSETYIFGDIDDIDCIIDSEKEVNLYRIIQGALSNIVKHAKANSAKVRIQLLNKNIQIHIIDNGIGFDVNEKSNSSKSVGLKIINERVKFLKGTLKIKSTANEGTTIQIKIPI